MPQIIYNLESIIRSNLWLYYVILNVRLDGDSTYDVITVTVMQGVLFTS